MTESNPPRPKLAETVIEHMATVGYKELNESGEFVIPGFVKMSVVHKPATEARSGVNPFTKEPMEFAAKPASKSVKASPLKVAKDLAATADLDFPQLHRRLDDGFGKLGAWRVRFSHMIVLDRAIRAVWYLSRRAGKAMVVRSLLPRPGS